ncbi:Mss4-like protein [Exophiala viscosa]|uniref:Mss4-like protein n=1 Tax=Exophiala viscosa TaxID=2486360 RepID=UPI0021951DA2|nr:Mss4-like protein [Exophiala viscosa]
MAFLPKEALTLTGGCYCKAIRYTIKIPAWDHRHAVPNAVETPISATETVETRLPVVMIDHCNTCRQVAGAILQSWLISPVGWVEWDVLSKEPADETLHLSTIDAIGPVRDNAPSTYVTRFNASDRATRAFCSRCGTTLTYISHKRIDTPLAAVDITVGSLDNESLKLTRPERHAWFDYGVDWVKSLLTKGDGGFLVRHGEGNLSIMPSNTRDDEEIQKEDAHRTCGDW